MAPADVPYGTLDLMILKTLDESGALHGYGLARRIEQVAAGMLSVNQGTIYPALVRLEQRGWIDSKPGRSDNNRPARFYSVTKVGKKQLTRQKATWARTVAVMRRMLGEEL